MRALTGALVVALLLGASAARAQKKDEARAAFQQGIEHFKANRFDQAVKAFRQAHAIKPSWRIQYNIGQCEAAAKRYGPAIEALEAYLSRGGDEIPPDRQDKVLGELARLRMKVGSIEIRGSNGVDVLIDGVKRGTTPIDAALRVSAGIDHELKLVRSGAAILTKQCRVGGGQTMTVTVPADTGPPPPTPALAAGVPQEAVPDGTPPPEEEDQTDEDGPTWKLYTGIAAATAGVAMYGMAIGYYQKGTQDIDDYKDAAARGDAEEYDRLENDVLPKDQAVVTTGLVLGSVLAATGVLLLFLEFQDDEEQAVDLALVPTPGGASATVWF